MDTHCVDPTEEQLAPVQALYDQGLFQQAFKAAGSLGPLHLWTGTQGRVLARRLARHLRADKLRNPSDIAGVASIRTIGQRVFFYGRWASCAGR
jgi:hypothetical protein